MSNILCLSFCISCFLSQVHIRVQPNWNFKKKIKRKNFVFSDSEYFPRIPSYFAISVSVLCTHLKLIRNVIKINIIQNNLSSSNYNTCHLIRKTRICRRNLLLFIRKYGYLSICNLTSSFDIKKYY